MDNEFPLCLSMTEFSMFRRCRKKFELGAIRGLSPRADNIAASNGRDFHAIMEWVAKNGGIYPQASEEELKPFSAMLPVAQAYYDHLVEKNELGKFDQVVSAERGYFAEVAPNVYIRCSFDLVYLDDGEPVVQDYKTFTKAPSLDAESDLDPQANEYTVTAKAALKLDRTPMFRWEYVRQELGRLLSAGKGKGAVYTEWERHERYMRQDLIISDEVLQTVQRELYECALDIREAIERGRYYRQGLNSGPHGCSSCFYRHLCKAELYHGMLDEQNIAALATYDDPASRTSAQTIEADPRVSWYRSRGLILTDAVKQVYGETGVMKIMGHYVGA